MTLPPGWTPFAEGFWPPDGAWLDALHPDGAVTRGVWYRHWDLWEQPKGFPLRRRVLGWRLAEGVSA